MQEQTDFGSSTAALRSEANRWLARFAPLVMDRDPGAVQSEIETQLNKVRELRQESTELQLRLRNLIGPDSPELQSTINRAVVSLDGIEEDLRRRLAALAPGHPDGLVDLDSLKDHLSEREARQELGVSLAPEIPPILEIPTSPSNPTAAGGLLVFAAGWLSFTTFHMVLMIGGMFAAFGWIALAMVLFYAIFYFAGFGMLAGAFAAGADERIVLNGRQLSVKRKLLWYEKVNTWQLSQDATATVGIHMSGAQAKLPGYAVLLHDETGRPIALGQALGIPAVQSGSWESSIDGLQPPKKISNPMLQKMADRINAYLANYG